MKKKIYSLMYVFALVCMCVACSNNEDPEPANGNQNAAVDPTRKVFANEQAVIDYLKSANYESSLSTGGGGEFTNLSVLEKFVKVTPFGDIVNDKYEYQVGEFIHKFGESGLTEYKIAFDKYADALKTIADDKAILNDLATYSKVDDNTYLISDGLYLIYTGYPIVESIDVTPPETRVSADGRTKVRISFVTSYTFVHSDCKIRVEAWELVDGKFVDYNTQLRANWQIGISEGGIILSSKGDTGLQTGHEWTSKALYKFTGINAPRYSFHSGTMSGSCKCWDGQWITANYTK